MMKIFNKQDKAMNHPAPGGEVSVFHWIHTKLCTYVIPAKAGINLLWSSKITLFGLHHWFPAFAGMTIVAMTISAASGEELNPKRFKQGQTPEYEQTTSRRAIWK